MSGAPPPALTRRAVLGSAAGLTALSSLSGTSRALSGTSRAARPVAATPTVLTWNGYLGVDLFRLFRATSIEEFRRIAGRLLEGVDPDRYAARADAIAAGIATAEADVVGLQEVTLVRTRRPGDSGSDSPDPAPDALVDFLSLVRSALADRGLDHEVAAATTTTDVELPAETEEGRVDVRLTDRDVLLVRADFETDDAAADTYETSLPVPIPGSDRTLALERGYCSVDVTVNGVGFTVVSTHLESISPSARRQQARELLDALPADRPVVVVGDFNSGPGTETETYDLLRAELRDAHAALDPGGEGFTCCQAGNLRNESSRLDRRIDALLYRGEVRPTAVGRVGHRPGDRVEVEVDGGTVRIWPSDHAGVVGTFDVARTAPTPTGMRTTTPTRTNEPTTTPTRPGTRTGTPASGVTPASSPTGERSSSTSDGAGSGMGVVAALVGLSAAIAARSRRD